jgi:IclR family acetate operon transcriptional repressor
MATESNSPLKGKRSDSAAIKSARRVLEVFEFFAERQRPATVGEISKALGYPQSSTSVLLKCMSDLKYIQRDSISRLYKPTLRLALTSSWLREEHLTGPKLTSVMTALRDKTGGSVVLGIQNDIHVQYIQVVPTKMPVQLVMHLGQLRPLCRTAVGKMLLSQYDDEKVSAIVRRINARADPPERVRLRALLEELKEIREIGLSYSENAASPGAAVIAALVPFSDRDLPMAIGIGGPIEHIKPHRAQISACLKSMLYFE